jgi:hypothetical protein
MYFKSIISFIFSVAFLNFTYDNYAMAENLNSSRFFVYNGSFSYTTFTVLKVTTTTTSIITKTTTCTTSTSILSTCTTGRRRRGLFYDESEANTRHRRAGLFYNEDEIENKDGTVFLPVAVKRLRISLRIQI